VEKFKTILFDLDGTLIDHFNVIYRCYQHAFQALGLPVPSYETVKASVGGSMEVTVRRFVDERNHAEAVRLYREHFSQIFLDDITVLPGVTWLLPALKAQGKSLALFTNKQGSGSRAICKHLGLDRHLVKVFGSLDTPHRKPEKAFSAHVLRELGADPATTCMVGDSPWDIQAAHVIGMPCYCVATGTHSLPDLVSAGADAVFADCFELGQAGFGLAADGVIASSA
jgi:phosphoglycolate phosphatase